MFKREWRSSLSGINGSWQIPVVSAEDVKFVNMTPTANDMQFEKWLNFLINIISSLYGIDPAEINFPNRGGATGSKGGSTLNEADPGKKLQQSQNKGLQPLLKFIEDLVNTHILSEFGDKYLFQFVGGDARSEQQKLEILQLEGKVFKTVNEIRKEKGLPPIEGGDAILNSEHIHSIGQVMQKEQIEYDRENENSNSESISGLTPQDKQQGFDGNSRAVNGKVDEVGKDGQNKDKVGYQKENGNEE